MSAVVTLNVHSLPSAVAAEDLAGTTCVVIDVLRATTTIAAALAAGARAVVPCLTIVDARLRAGEFPPGEAVLAGERGGLPIVGFDLGNSPAEFTPQVVQARAVVLTTTNGTKALLHASAAREILVGALVNLSAVCSVLQNAARVDVLCAGTDGEVTDEDLLTAGAIVSRLTASGSWELNVDAAAARAMWQRVTESPGPCNLTSRLITAMRASRGGANLVAIGMESDIAWAAAIDRLAVVPRFDPVRGEIAVNRG